MKKKLKKIWFFNLINERFRMLSDDHRLKRKQVRYINKIVHTKTSGKPIFDFDQKILSSLFPLDK